MATKQLFKEFELAVLAKEYRLKSGLTKIEAAAKLGLTRPTIQQAEENPEQSLTKVRCRMIEKFSPFKVEGPLFRLRRK